MTEFFTSEERARVLEPEVLPDEETISLDIVKVENTLKQFMVKLDDLVGQATSHEVTDQASNERSIEMIGQSKKLFSRLDNKRLEFVGPFKDYTSKIDSLVRPYKQRLTVDIIRPLQRKSGAWMQGEKERERKAREEEMKKRADDAKRMQFPDALDMPAPDPVLPPQEKIKVAGASATPRSDFDFDIQDIASQELRDLVFGHALDVYVKAAEKALKNFIKLGGRKCVGVKIFPITTLDIRRTLD